MIALLGGRMAAYGVMALFVLGAVASIIGGARHKGAVAEAGKWEAVVGAKMRGQADRNMRLNLGTIEGDAALDKVERDIREHWGTAGRTAPAAPVAAEPPKEEMK